MATSAARRPSPEHRVLVLVGFNGSPRGERALAYAAGHAARTGAELLLLAADEDPALWPTHARQRDQRLRTLVGRAEAALAGLDVNWRMRISGAAPSAALRESAREYRADLIVVGASTTRWRRLLSRQVGATLARDAPAPLLVVP
ncbi:universal stress protein [Kitasatospora sp. NPDC052896]|uniref:universal stress protein n=1 Tax=Kitasatospora sp. NPDC052896 TaxID=3364061 RepID=UPI0037CAD8A4